MPPSDLRPPGDADEVTTQPLGAVGHGHDDPHVPEPPFDRPSTVVRLFGSDDFFRLWLAQVVSAMGDWIGFLAIIAIAGRIGGDSPAAAISLVLSARMIPGFFLAPLAGVIVDRWDRKKVMVGCDLVRGGVLLTLPFIDHIWTLVLASLILEIGTLLWSPAKEASVPNLVPPTHLATANSLSIVAAYGTFPVATLLFAFLAKVATWLSGIDSLDFLKIDQEFIAVYVDVLTFGLSAVLISTLALRRPAREKRQHGERTRIDFYSPLRDLREGWHFMFVDPTVRAVMVGISTGLIGGGMVVPLGDIFSKRVLGGGSAGFGFLLTGMGFGMAGGVLLVTAMQKRLPKARVFCWSVLGAGVTISLASVMETLLAAVVLVALLGICAGAVYVLGFTILQENVPDELRGRVFASLYTLVRFCLLLSFAIGPLLAVTLGQVWGQLFGGRSDAELADLGVRLALAGAGIVILAAGILAITTLKAGERREPVT